MPTDITAFIAARLGEEEQIATSGRASRHVLIVRLLLAEHPQVEAWHLGNWSTGCATCHADPDCGITIGNGVCQTVRLLAIEWSEHPGYQPGWAPQ